ncbi:hypothetical protein CO675_21040 [Bradyrhizobium sp. C9]|nr:hypothetical protein CO675_21040 [Bradyrhizobium sp. C9]
MTGLPGSLSIALSLVGSIWLVGVVALLVGAPGELVAATFVVGLVTGIAEWRGMIRKSGHRFSDRGSCPNQKQSTMTSHRARER